MHTITLRHFPAYGEHRADCTCGWTGSYLRTRREAMREWDGHVDQTELAAIHEETR